MATIPNQAALAAIQGAGLPPSTVQATAVMAPITAAGVELAKRTMWMISGALVLLVLLLALAERSQSGASQRISEHQEKLVYALESSEPDPALRELALALRQSAKDGTSPIANAGAMIQDITAAKRATAAQEAILSKCKAQPVPPASDRPAVLSACADVIDAINSADRASAQKIGLITDIRKGLADERAAYRAFWLQMAQLVLINLLLPILTALLGYIFGTQQSSGQSGR